MKIENLIRIIRSLHNGNISVFEKVMKTIITEEKKAKHTKIVRELEKVCKQVSDKEIDKTGNTGVSFGLITNHGKNFLELPKNPRSQQQLATLIEHDDLRHHMILDEHTENRFKSIEKEFSARFRLSKYNLVPKRKILLYGPPGCGKTLGAERIAWNIGLPLLKVNFDNLISSYLGETSSNLRAIFDASHKMPCVLLLDECDIIAKSRIQKQDVGEMSRIVNMLLVLLDEYFADGLIIATTNLEESLDKAIYRRFDDIIPISLPNQKQIINLVKDMLATLPADKSVNINRISEKLQGLSSAGVVSITKSAMKNSILQGQKAINNDTFIEAINNYYQVH